MQVHRRGHQQGDDEGKALVGIIPGLIDAAAQQRCIRDESVQDSEANTFCSFASVPILV